MTGLSCATTSHTMFLGVRIAVGDVVGGAGDRCVAGGDARSERWPGRINGRSLSMPIRIYLVSVTALDGIDVDHSDIS